MNKEDLKTEILVVILGYNMLIFATLIFAILESSGNVLISQEAMIVTVSILLSKVIYDVLIKEIDAINDKMI